jgi:hypothetical protein
LSRSGSGGSDVLGAGDYTKGALTVLEHWRDPNPLKKTGRKRSPACSSARAEAISAGTRPTSCSWRQKRRSPYGRPLAGLDFAELDEDTAEVRIVPALDVGWRLSTRGSRPCTETLTRRHRRLGAVPRHDPGGWHPRAHR